MPSVRVILSAFSVFLVLALAPGRALGNDTTLVDGTAAIVAKVLITVQDAHFFSAVNHFSSGDPIPAKGETGEDLRAIVQKMALEEMIYAEMKSLQVQDGGSSNEASRLIQAQKNHGREAEWSRCVAQYGRTEKEAIQRLYKSLQVEKFLQKKIETLTPIITDAEVERYFAQNPRRFKGADLEVLKPSVVLLLKKERMQKGLEEWVRVLKEKYGVTNLLNG